MGHVWWRGNVRPCSSQCEQSLCVNLHLFECEFVNLLSLPSNGSNRTFTIIKIWDYNGSLFFSLKHDLRQLYTKHKLYISCEFTCKPRVWLWSTVSWKPSPTLQKMTIFGKYCVLDSCSSSFSHVMQLLNTSLLLFYCQEGQKYKKFRTNKLIFRSIKITWWNISCQVCKLKSQSKSVCVFCSAVFIS